MEQDFQKAGISLRHFFFCAISAGLLCFAVYESLLGWMQLLKLIPSRHALYPATGTFYNPGPYCGFLALAAPLALGAILRCGCRTVKWLSYAYLAMAAPLMPALMGRTGWIACAAGCLFTLAACKRLPRPSGKGFAVCAAATAAAAAALVWLKPASALGRVFLWIVGIRAALSHPISGCGWDNVGGALGEAQEEYFRAHPDSIFSYVAGCPEYPFSDYLQIAVAYGIPAMCLFVAAIALSAICAFKSGKPGLCGSLLAFSVVCSASYPLQFAEFWIAAAMLCIAALSPYWRRPWAAAAMAIIAGCASYDSCMLTHREKMENMWMRQRHAHQWRLSNNDISYLDSLAGGPLGSSPKFLFDYGKALRQSELYEKSNSILLHGVACSSDPMFLALVGRNFQDMGQCEAAAKFYCRALDRVPNRLYPCYLLAKLYSSPECFDYEKFLYFSGMLLHATPKVDSPAARQMKAEISILGDSIKSARQ